MHFSTKILTTSLTTFLLILYGLKRFKMVFFQFNIKKECRKHHILSTFFSGLDGSRTRVQKPIPCPSTSVVYSLTFPPPHENKHPCGFSSFMIRPQVQSLACVVSHRVEAWILKCECPRSDCCH